MEESGNQVPPRSVDKAQHLRLKRILGGCIAYVLTGVVVASSWLFGYLDGLRALAFVAAVVAINGTACILVLTGANLRFKDPSLTGPLIIASLWPSVYVMYYIDEPMLRAPFLLMATVAMLFGALAFEFRQMLRIGGVVLIAYLLMLLALEHFAPQRVDMRVEAIIIIAYTLVLVQIAFLGSFIAGLRERLREKNASLLATMSELEDLATRDPLTRLPNRHTAMQQLERELSRSERPARDGDGLCVALLDVDEFKRINDRFGHRAGDQVLRSIGRALAGALRQGDFIARFGGEEFLIILPQTSLAGAELAVERMRTTVAGLSVQDLTLPETVTVSIGLAQHDPGHRIEETLDFADKALYRAKDRGRNRVEIWRDTPPSEAAAS